MKITTAATSLPRPQRGAKKVCDRIRSMKLALFCTALCGVGSMLAVEVAPQEEQIASAILAAPKERRAAATVLGYNEKGDVVTLRKGTNDMICLADDPAAKGISVACYHKDLEPFMARGRELNAQYK